MLNVIHQYMLFCYRQEQRITSPDQRVAILTEKLWCLQSAASGGVITASSQSPHTHILPAAFPPVTF